ncbi:MAG: hypothetical protein FJ344_00850 [Sphingomonadales bacterium]|nr:hypothetical protein [Sphingomonadales bacterium]
MQEGIDYYITADGKYVFTEVYLKRRGQCCRLHCRHCPYGSHPNVQPHIPENSEIIGITNAYNKK